MKAEGDALGTDAGDSDVARFSVGGGNNQVCNECIPVIVFLA